MRFIKLSLAALLAAGVLGALVGAASAGRLSLSGQTFRATFASVEYFGGASPARCALTLEGSFHSRTIVKTAGSLVGYVTRAVHGVCQQPGSATVLTATLPWHVRYRAFSGALPNISSTSLDLIGFSVNIREPSIGLTCLVRSTAEQPATLTFNREAAGVLSSVGLGGEIVSNCVGIRFRVAGTSNSLTALNSTTRITLTLI